MKKILSIIFAMLAISSCSVYAATDVSRSVGVVVIGGAEFKTPEFYKIIEKGFDPKSNSKIVVGNDLQNKYQKYLFNNDLSVNTLPSKRTLVNFVAASGYGKILFIEISDTNIDHQNNAKSRQKDRIAIQVDSYLCDNLNVLLLSDQLAQKVFGSAAVMEILDCSPPTALSYLKRLHEELKLIEPVESPGKGTKYRFI